jgi:hypothetical protein
MHPFDALVTQLSDRADLQETIRATTGDEDFRAALAAAAVDLEIELSVEDLEVGLAAMNASGVLEDSQLDAVVGGAGTLFGPARTFLGSVSGCWVTCANTNGSVMTDAGIVMQMTQACGGSQLPG